MYYTKLHNHSNVPLIIKHHLHVQCTYTMPHFGSHIKYQKDDVFI